MKSEAWIWEIFQMGMGIRRRRRFRKRCVRAMRRDETRRDATPGRASRSRERERDCLVSSAGSFVRWFVGDAMRIG